jgi:arginase
VRLQEVEAGLEFPTDAGVAFDLARGIRSCVAGALRDGRVPVVLAGNCMSSVGTLAGLGGHAPAVVWFDAHADLNTPDTTRSGFLDGTALATVMGRCWRGMLEGVPGFSPIAEERVVLVGARDLDPSEQAMLATSRIRRVPVGADGGLDPSALEDAVRAAEAGADGVYLHFDLDVIDPEQARANGFAALNGVRIEAAVAAVSRIRSTARIRAMAVTAYDPSYDAQGAVVRAASMLVLAALEGDIESSSV